MPWQNPKTNWKSADVVGPDDLNRIEENIRVHANDKNNPHNVTSAQVGAVSKAGDTMIGSLRTLHAFPIILKLANYKSFVVHHPVFDSIIITSSASKDGEDWDWNKQVELTADGVLKVMGNPVWHAGNHGPGSGLNADMVDGVHVTGSGTPGLRKITVSTADPSGGSDGDVWIKYE